MPIHFYTQPKDIPFEYAIKAADECVWQMESRGAEWPIINAAIYRPIIRAAIEQAIKEHEANKKGDHEGRQ